MFFSLGIETPKKQGEAFGIVVPALCQEGYACFSASDTEEEIPTMATEAILMIVEDMINGGGMNIESIHNDHLLYVKNPDYAYCDLWAFVYVDLSSFSGKQKRINITLPDVLIGRIDAVVKGHKSIYKDRSHFLAQAAKKELLNV